MGDGNSVNRRAQFSARSLLRSRSTTSASSPTVRLDPLRPDPQVGPSLTILASLSLRRLAPVAFLLAACSSDPTPPGPEPRPEFSYRPAVQWSGGIVTLRSAFFHQHTALPAIKVDDSTVAAVRVDDSTVNVPLPVMPTGSVMIRVVGPDSDFTVGSVDVKGFASSSALAVPLAGFPIFAMSPDGPVTLTSYLSGIDIVGLAITQLRTGHTDTTRELHMNRWDLHPGITYLPDQIIALDSTNTPYRWQLFPLAKLDASPTSAQSRFSVQLNDSTWFDLGQHQTTVHRLNQGDTYVRLEDPYAPVISTSAGRLAMSVGTGSKVFDLATGDSLYSLPLRWTNGAAFSTNGQFLYAGGDSAGAQMLMAARADNGTVLKSVQVGAGIQSINVNEGGSRIFVTGILDSKILVLVYEASTLELVGTLRAPTDVVCCGYTPSSYLDEPQATLYVVSTISQPTVMFRFDVTPETVAAMHGTP